jgi:hypothetical protein
MDMPQQLAGPGSNIPPQALAALQQQQSGGMDITAILAQLAEMSPDEVSAALQQLGIQVDPDTLHDAAAQWVEQAGDKQTGGSADDEQPTTSAADGEGEEDVATTSPPSAPTTDDEAAEVAPDDEEGEGEGEVASSQAGQGGAGTSYPVRAGGAGRSAPPNTANVGGGGGGGGMNMDALISAALSQGDPNSMPPPMPVPMRPPGVAGGAPQIPSTQMRGAPTAAGEDPRARAMIASIYRDAASKPRAASRANMPPTPRTRMPPTAAAARRR